MILLLSMFCFGGSTYAVNATVVAPAIYGQSEDPYLLAAMSWVESRWNPKAISKTGDCGLLQVNYRWSRYSCEELLDIHTNVKASISSIRYWRGRFGKDWLCHYNSGNKCYRRSRNYAAKVRRIMKEMRGRVK